MIKDKLTLQTIAREFFRKFTAHGRKECDQSETYCRCPVIKITGCDLIPTITEALSRVQDEAMNCHSKMRR